MTPSELRRRLWHMSPGLLPFLLWLVPHPDPASGDFLLVISLFATAVGYVVYSRYAHIRRGETDRDRLGAVLGYGVPVCMPLILFQHDAEIAFAVLATLAFGDGSATLGGMLLGGPRLPWNRRKSWSGLACCLLAGSTMATLTYWGESNNAAAENIGATWRQALCVGGVAAALCAVAESISSRWNDNLRVGLTAALSVTLLHAWFVRPLIWF